MELTYKTIEQWVAEEKEETLHLEFKEIAREKTTLNKDDRKLIAKAVGGMCNSEGGKIILGVKTTRKDGLDVAVEKKDIADAKALANVITSWLPDMLSPQHHGIRVEPLLLSQGDSRGFILIDVPSSDSRPHMSVAADHRYFRRGSDGTRVMEHGEVRDAFLAPRQGELEFDLSFSCGMMSGNLKFEIFCLVGVRNVGRVPVRAPYLLELEKPARLQRSSAHGSDVNLRVNREGNIGIYGRPDLIVHMSDSLYLVTIPMYICINQTCKNNYSKDETRDIIDGIIHDEDINRFAIGYSAGSSTFLHNNVSYGAFSLDLAFQFGSELIPRQDASIKLSKLELLKLMAKPVCR